MINRLVIVGVGLIGGSLALALKKAKFVRNIIGVGRSEVNLNIARDLRIVDEIVVNADVVEKSKDPLYIYNKSNKVYNKKA